MPTRVRRTRVRAAVLAVLLAGAAGAASLAPPAVPEAIAVPLPGDPPPHWGRSPFFPDCLEGPCRAVIVIDKTFDPAWSVQIRRWVEWMTHVRVNHNLNLPAFGYFGGAEGVLPDAACHAFRAAITICVNDAVVDADCAGSSPGILCLQSSRTVPDNHFHSIRLSFRERSFQPADRWNLVCSQMGRAIGLSSDQPDTASCMNNPGALGFGVERYYVTDDWVTLWTIYGHPPP